MVCSVSGRALDSQGVRQLSIRSRIPSPIRTQVLQTDDRSGYVPVTAQGVVHGSVKALLADQQLREGVNAQIQTLSEQGSYTGPTTIEGIVNQANQQSGLDFRELSETLGFWGTGASDTTVLLWTNWTESTVADQLSNPPTKAYRERTLYTPDTGTQVAVLDDGVYRRSRPSASGSYGNRRFP